MYLSVIVANITLLCVTKGLTFMSTTILKFYSFGLFSAQLYVN